MHALRNFLYFSEVHKRLSISLAGLAAIGFVACSNGDKTAGGGPSGTEAGNAITAQIMVAGEPAAYARVKLTEIESLDALDSEYVQADKKGLVTFDNVSDGVYTLEARHDGMALQKEVPVEGHSVDLGKSDLEKMVSVTGSISGDDNGIVKVRGMAHSAKVENGKFSMDSLPAGPLSLVFIPDQKDHDTSSTYLKLVAGETSTASTFAEESRALLLDDFQDSNYQNRFMPALTWDGGWWYFAFADSNVTPKFVTDDDSHNVTLEVDSSGNIMAHVAATFGDTFKDSNGNTLWPWATIGLELGKSDKSLCNDISSVDTIAFRAKGEGAIVFGLLDETQKPEFQNIAQYEFTLSDKWERTLVPLKEILNPEYSYTCVNQLVWNFKANNDEKTVEIWLDDIELIGGNRLSIWKRW